MPSLYEITQNAMYLQALLEDGEIDERVYNDSVEGLCAEHKIEDICKVLKNLESKEAAFKAEVDRMNARRKTLNNSIERLKDSVLTYMQATDTKKLEAGLFTLSIRNNKSVSVWDISRVPDQYLIHQDPKVDKKAITDAIKAGEVVDGAEFVEGQSLNIR